MSGASGREGRNKRNDQGYRLVPAIREAGRYSQEGLAKELGVSFPTVNSWERGRSRPRQAHVEALESLAESLGIRTDLAVLVIDDDPLACEVMAGLIKGSPTYAEVYATTDSSEGLLLCGAVDPDILFLDIMMPGIDGFDLARRLDDLHLVHNTQVVFVTASTDPAVDARASKAGHTVLHKPVRQESIDQLLGEIGARDLAR